MIDHIKHWLTQHPLSPIHVDCATTVMLKILDGKCKMSAEEKTVMAELYQQVKNCPNQLLDADIHQNTHPMKPIMKQSKRVGMIS